MKRGFTLVEVLVAVTLAGILVSTAGGVYAASSTVVDDLMRRGAAWDRDTSWRIWLAEALAGAEVNVDRDNRFRGDSTTMDFQSWQLTSGGWAEPTHLVAAVRGGRLELFGSGAPPLVLGDSVVVTFAYLGALGANSPWLPAWESNTSVPRAVRLILGKAHTMPSTDTLVFVVGERG